MAYGEPLNSTDDLKGRDGIDLLARMIYSEAGNQSEKGKRGFTGWPGCRGWQRRWRTKFRQWAKFSKRRRIQR